MTSEKVQQTILDLLVRHVEMVDDEYGCGHKFLQINEYARKALRQNQPVTSCIGAHEYLYWTQMFSDAGVLDDV